MHKPPNIQDDSYEFEDVSAFQDSDIGEIKVGDIVKLIFRIRILNNQSQEEIVTERMWVVVDGFENDIILGTLDNSANCTDKLQSGCSVIFQQRNVLTKW